MSELRVAKHHAVFITYQIEDQAGGIVERIDIPVGYVHGAGGNVIEKIEQALEGHIVGDTRDVTLTPDEGFGPHHPELTFTDDIDNVPPQFRRVGAEVEMQNERGEAKLFRVTRIEGGKLTVDGNHPLAGQTVTFHVKIEQIREATPQEIAAGVPEGNLGHFIH